MAGVRQMAGERGAVVHVRDLCRLLRLEGTDFIMAAYRLVLGREADPAGLRGYEARARHYPGRMMTVCSLLLSPERMGLPAWLRRLRGN